MTNLRATDCRLAPARWLVPAVALLLMVQHTLAWALPPQSQPRVAVAQASGKGPEAQLIEIYRLVGQGQSRQALTQAEHLVKAHPHFQLAQLVYGDLLTARTRGWRKLGDGPPAPGAAAAETLAELREESLLRLQALRERPPAGHVPAQFLRLAPRSRHAIAVDASRARLYLFENSARGLRLLGDYYISVGKAGTDKLSEGDMRTPLGMYYITSTLERSKLLDFYGAGALPINYPNPYDMLRGRTGSGIWLHGTPPQQFSRAPRASDGCVVLANPDLEHIIRTVEIRTTPVLIARQLQWVAPHAAQSPEVLAFTQALSGWQAAKSSGDLSRLSSFYARELSTGHRQDIAVPQLLKAEFKRTRGRPIELKDLSYLRWTDSADTMVVTFGEVPVGQRTGPIKRQYWIRKGQQWKIFFEGVIG